MSGRRSAHANRNHAAPTASERMAEGSPPGLVEMLFDALGERVHALESAPEHDQDVRSQRENRRWLEALLDPSIDARARGLERALQDALLAQAGPPMAAAPAPEDWRLFEFHPASVGARVREGRIGMARIAAASVRSFVPLVVLDGVHRLSTARGTLPVGAMVVAHQEADRNCRIGLARIRGAQAPAARRLPLPPGAHGPQSSPREEESACPESHASATS